MFAMVCVATSAALALPAEPAVAKPKQTLSQAKAELAKLNKEVDRLDDKYNKAKGEWQAAKAKLATLTKSVKEDQKTYDGLRQRVAQLAAAAYESGGQEGDLPTLAASKDPEDVLGDISMFTQLSRNRSTAVTQFLAAAQMLKRQQAEAQEATDDLASKKNVLVAQQKKIKKSVDTQQKLVDKLGGGPSSGPIGGTYTGPASGPTRVALQYAFSKLGDPYVFGGAGPNSFDCSGLTMMAWRQAGVSLSHYVPDQYNETRRVAKADLQPGDLVFFDGLNHVGMYIGGGQFIHAPHTGTVVQKENLNGPYYSGAYYGAGRP
jgi:cell wall-associated NlpC family hydrolase